MNLSRKNLQHITARGVIKPANAIFSLPEKVLQFGTGVLLRGLPDYFIDKANRQGLFNGRVVVVKSTDGGDAGAFDRQDSLYTLCVRGIEEGNLIFSKASRVLGGSEQKKLSLRILHIRQLSTSSMPYGAAFGIHSPGQKGPRVLVLDMWIQVSRIAPG